MSVADLDVVAYLASKGVQTHAASGPEVTAHCFFCPDGDPKGKGKLYINTDEGFYDCKRCGATGGTYLLQKHFGDEPIKAEPGQDPNIGRKIRDWAADVGAAMLANNDDMLLYLMHDRGLSPETILERKLGWIGNSWSLTGSLPETFKREDLLTTGLVYRDGPKKGHDFFYNHLLIPYVNRGHVVQIRGKVHGAKYFTGPGDPARIYNTDALDGADDVMIVEGEYDCMVVVQHLSVAPDDRARKIAVVALPGAKKLSDDQVKYFSHAKRVYLALDPDDTGKRAAAEIKEQLGTRARIVELPAELPKCDWTEYLLPVPPGADAKWHLQHPHAGHDWRDIVDLLGSSSGKRVFTMREAGHSYRNQRDDGVLIKTGYLQLDSVIGGCKPGQVMVILAKTGTGKTILLCNMAYAMREHNVLLISLEMTREEVYERMRRIFLFHYPTASDHQLEEAMSKILICDENRLGEKDLSTLVDEYEVETGVRPDVVMVDYLGYYARGQKGNSPYEKTTNAVMQLKAEAKAGRFVCISPAQVNRGTKEGKPIDLDDARDSGAIEETADFLLSIWRPDDALAAEAANMQQSGKVKITILKSRHGGKDRTFTLVMDLLTLAIVDDNTPAAKRCAEHNYLAWRGEKWEDLRKHELHQISLGTQTEMPYRKDVHS
jgi:archaellum biogenesis ATPase FlaH/5S rRNA maturation endonuclease (ribonuclease M5)